MESDYERALGALLIGLLLNAYLFGLISWQFVHYIQLEFDDRRTTRIFLSILYLLHAIYSFGVCYMAYFYWILNFSNPNVISIVLGPFSFATSNQGFLISLLTQGYLVCRLYHYTKSKTLFTSMLVLAVTSFALGVAVDIFLATKAPDSSVRKIAAAWSSVAIATDICIAVASMVLFWRSRTGQTKTDSVLSCLMVQAAQMALFPTIVAIIVTALYMSGTMLAVSNALAIPMGGVWIANLFSLVISRDRYRRELEGTQCSLSTLDISTTYGYPADVEAGSNTLSQTS